MYFHQISYEGYRESVNNYEDSKMIVTMQREAYKLAIAFRESMKQLTKESGSALQARMLYAQYKEQALAFQDKANTNEQELLRHDKEILDEEDKVLEQKEEVLDQK